MSLTLEAIFDKAQANTIHHTKLIDKLVELYKKPTDNFQKKFKLCLKNALINGDSRPATRVLDFVSQFCSLLEARKHEMTNGCESNLPTNIQNDEDDDPMHPFVSDVLRELLQINSCSSQSARMRICYCIKTILQCLGPEASVDSDIGDEIYAAMLERLKDKSPLVRAQSVTALERLQDPSDPECPVVKAFLFHLSRDPSAEVRRVVLLCLGRSKHSLPHIRNRIHDVKDFVRKQAYLSLSKVSIRSHSIKNRELILSQGLKERSDIVRETVEKVLIPNWFENCHENFLEFLHALDIENSEVSELALKVLFRLQIRDKLINDLGLGTDKLICPEKLTVELSFYWRCLAEYLQSEEDGMWELILPELSPFCKYIETNLIKLKEINVAEKIETWDHSQNDFIILQLLNLTKVFDLADEVGRGNLKQLLLNMLMNPDVRLKLVPTIVDILVKVVPDVNTRLLLIAETISEIHDPLTEEIIEISDEEKRKIEFKHAQLRVQKNILEDDLDLAVQEKKFLEAENLKNSLAKITEELQALSAIPTGIKEVVMNRPEDPGILSKCLTIVYEMMQSPTVKTLAPQLRSLMDNFVKNSLKVEHAVVQVLALQCLAVFSLLDETIAKDVIVVLCLYLGSSCDEISLVAAKGIFDLLLLYGLDTFCLTEEDAFYDKEPEKKKQKKNLMRKSTFIEDSNEDFVDETFDEIFDETITEGGNESESEKKNYHLLSLLINHLDTSEGPILECIVGGLCKLLLAMRISSPKLLSRLIILWFNPIHEDDIYLQQLLGQFFKMYATVCPLSQETLEQCFLPTINTVLNAPSSSPLYQVDVETVAKFLLELTKNGVNQHSADVCIHKNLALKICNELLLDDYDAISCELINILCQMDLALDGEEKINFQKMALKITKKCPDRVSIRAIQKFQSILNLMPQLGLCSSDGVEQTRSECLDTLNSTRQNCSKRSSSFTCKSGSMGSDDASSKTLRNHSSNMIPSSVCTIIPNSSESGNTSDEHE